MGHTEIPTDPCLGLPEVPAIAVSPSPVPIGWSLYPELTTLTFLVPVARKWLKQTTSILWVNSTPAAPRRWWVGVLVCLLHLCGIFFNRILFLKVKVIYKMLPYYTPATQPLLYCTVPILCIFV